MNNCDYGEKPINPNKLQLFLLAEWLRLIAITINWRLSLQRLWALDLTHFFGYIVDPPVNQNCPPSFFLPKFNFVITVWWSHVWKKLRNSDTENHCWLDRMSAIGRPDSYLHSPRYIERVKGVRSITVWFLSSSPRRWWSVSSIPIRLQAKTPHSLLQRVESCDIAFSIFNTNILQYILNTNMLKMINVSSIFSLSALWSKTCQSVASTTSKCCFTNSHNSTEQPM